MDLEVGGSKTPSRSSASRSKAPAKSGGQKGVPSGALEPNPLRDRDRVWGNQARSDGSALERGVDILRGTHDRKGESFAEVQGLTAGSALAMEGAIAMASLESMAVLEGRSRAYHAEDSAVCEVRDAALQRVYDAESVGKIEPDAAKGERERIREAYELQMASLEVALKAADERNRQFLVERDAEETGLDVIGEASFGRAAMMDLLVTQYVGQRIQDGRPMEDPEMAKQKARFEGDLETVTIATAPLALEEAQGILSDARSRIDAAAEGMLADTAVLDRIRKDIPEGKALLEAIEAYRTSGNLEERLGDAFRRDREIALRDGLAVLDGTGEIAFLDHLSQVQNEGRGHALDMVQVGALDGARFYERLSVLADQRRDLVEGLKDEDVASPSLVKSVRDVHSFSEAAETELILARQEKDEAGLRLMLAARGYYDAVGSKEQAEQTNDMIRGMLAGRAQGTDVRTLDEARDHVLKEYKKEAIRFVDANISLLEAPDKLPDLEILRIKASAASRNMGFFEAWNAMGDVNPRDWREQTQKWVGYCSIMQDSLAFRSVAWGASAGKALAEHTAAGMYALLNSAGQIALVQGTQLSNAVATGHDTGVGIQMGMGAMGAAGDSFAKAWGLLLLSKNLGEEKKRNRMERDNQLRARLENREREIDKIVKNRTDGITIAADYFDGGQRFREGIKALINAESTDREARKVEVLSLLDRLDTGLKRMLPDHAQNHKFISEHPELSPTALRRNAAETMLRFGLREEAAAFDPEVAARSGESRLGRANVHQAVDAWKQFVSIMQTQPDPDRPVPPLETELRDLGRRHYGSHGALAAGMFVVDTKEGPAGVLLNTNQPPGVAIVPLSLDEKGDFQGFPMSLDRESGRWNCVQTFDLMDLGGEAGREALTKYDDPEFHVKLLNEQWHKFADSCGLNLVQSEAIRGYLQAAQTNGGLPFQSTLPQSLVHYNNLRNAGIAIPPTGVLDDPQILPMSEGAQTYWKHHYGAHASTDKLRAVVRGLAESSLDNMVAAQTFTQAARGRLERYRALQREAAREHAFAAAEQTLDPESGENA